MRAKCLHRLMLFLTKAVFLGLPYHKVLDVWDIYVLLISPNSTLEIRFCRIVLIQTALINLHLAFSSITLGSIHEIYSVPSEPERAGKRREAPFPASF